MSTVIKVIFDIIRFEINAVSRQKCPDVYRLTESCGCAWSIVATKWFICLYVDVIPVEVSMPSVIFVCGSRQDYINWSGLRPA